MGNLAEKSSKKLLAHPHLKEQISQAFEYGNVDLLRSAGLVSGTELLQHFPKTPVTDPRHAYSYLRITTDLDDSKRPRSATIIRFVEEHHNALYSHVTRAAIEGSVEEDKWLNAPAVNMSGHTETLDRVILEHINNEGTSTEELDKSYPVRKIPRSIDGVTDDHLYWLLLAGEDLVEMEIDDEQKPRLLSALIRADQYASSDRLTSEDLYQMVPAILTRWHHLRVVASNYLMEVLAPYYFPLFEFLFKHNGLNEITQNDANLLSLLYPNLLEEHAVNWSKGPSYHRTVKCLSNYELYRMLGGNITAVFPHPRNGEVWRDQLIEYLAEDLPPEPITAYLGYYGSPWCNRVFDSGNVEDGTIKDGNITDLKGNVISEYNPSDVVVICDRSLTTQYYITRSELPEVLRTKINPYNQETLSAPQVETYQGYLDWHRNNVMPVVAWTEQWKILRDGLVIPHAPERFDGIIDYYLTNGEITTSDIPLTEDGKYRLEVDPAEFDSMDPQEMLGVMEEAVHDFPEDDPLSGNLKGLFSNIKGIVNGMEFDKAKKGDSSRIKQIEE